MQLMSFMNGLQEINMCSQNNQLKSLIIMWFVSFLFIFLAYILGHFKLMTEFFVLLFTGASILVVTFLRYFHLATQAKLDDIISLLKQLTKGDS